DLVEATNHVRGHFGLQPLEPAGVYRLVGHGARALVERALGEEWKSQHDEGERVLLRHYGEHCLDHTRPFPGLSELIDRLAGEGCRFAVVTNKTEALSRRLLDGLDLTRRLVAVIGGDTLPTRKPDPAGVEQIRRRCGVAASACLLVGDS